MTTIVEIPGQLVARVENGRIKGYSFLALANDAGYFGDNIRVIEGDEIGDIEFFDLVGDTLAISEDRKSAFFTVEFAS